MTFKPYFDKYADYDAAQKSSITSNDLKNKVLILLRDGDKNFKDINKILTQPKKNSKLYTAVTAPSEVQAVVLELAKTGEIILNKMTDTYRLPKKYC